MQEAQLRILVLDDDPLTLKLLERMLANLGFEAVATCARAGEALQAMDHGRVSPDLILLDLNMPQMDGVEFVRHLGERDYAGHLILVSGEDERMLQAAERLVRAHRLRALGHLSKPVQPQGLAELVRQCLSPAARGRRGARRIYDADELRAAIDNAELSNVYQPQVDMTSGRPLGVEALVRWSHPADGLVFPDQFIGTAEAHGLIDALTRVVLDGALRQARAWHDAGHALRVAVNLSMNNLASVDFADFVIARAADIGVAAPSVVLELTESRLMKDARVPLEIMTRLRMKRFRLSIDDFGTGHATMAQLRNIPFDELKVDRQFVHGAWQDSATAAMCASSCDLARQLCIEVVAEGVEDHDDWAFLRRTGCQAAQGYLIAKPMPAAEVPAWIERWRQRWQLEFAHSG